MDKQTTGWWILLAFSLRLAFLLSLASDQLTLAGCSLDGLALWAPLRLVPVVPVDRAKTLGWKVDTTWIPIELYFFTCLVDTNSFTVYTFRKPKPRTVSYRKT
ncbi:hypothetical protein AFLA_004612 [Aspergillus flavus NRRL3357]|nr:hypothetical protein AFLA_004612 [Aspergillus flavus NRRL3357]